MCVCVHATMSPELSEPKGNPKHSAFLFFFKKKNQVSSPCGQKKKRKGMPGLEAAGLIRFHVTLLLLSWCSKSQIIDLQAEGYWEELMDTTQPKIIVKDW